MTSRERVMKAVNHEEPDRVPLDLGGTIMSGIMAMPLDRLRKHLGLEDKPVRVYEVFQMLGEVEMDLVDRFKIDVLPVEPPTLFFDYRRENYKPWKLWDGTQVLVPGQFQVFPDDKGNLRIHKNGDPCAEVEARMPKDGFYFDMLSFTETHFDFEPPPLKEAEIENHLSDEDLEFLQARAERLRRETDKALLLGCWGNFGLGGVGTIPDFLMLLAMDKQYVKDLFEIRTATAIKNFEKVKRYLGDSIDIIGLDGTDYGSQKAELFSPDLFEELYVPYFRKQNDWVHEHTKWKTWMHTCGSIAQILPFIVETHIDIVNPVQTSASGMDPAWLKQNFGSRVCFWGGGIDTQKTFPFGTAQEVDAEVRERIKTFGPGGGFVFNPIHNIQHGTPPENIVAAYETARECGAYPIA